MSELVSRLTEAKSLFQTDEKGLYRRGMFVDYSTSLNVVARTNPPSPACKLVAKNLQFIHQDLWNIASLIQRIEWMRNCAIAGELSRGDWMVYTSLDVEHFHIEVRSLFDYVAVCIRAVSDRPGCVPTSFREIGQWLGKKHVNRRRLGEDLASLVEEALFFPELREVRDDLVHRGAYSLTFESPSEGVLFQVYKDFANAIAFPDVMHNENVVDFCRYAAVHLACLLSFLERFATALSNRIPINRVGIGEVQNRHPGHDIFLSWLNSFMDLCQR